MKKYIRFGLPSKDGFSWNDYDKKYEMGLSVYHAEEHGIEEGRTGWRPCGDAWDKVVSDRLDQKVLRRKPKLLMIGCELPCLGIRDGEPLLRPCSYRILFGLSWDEDLGLFIRGKIERPKSLLGKSLDEIARLLSANRK